MAADPVQEAELQAVVVSYYEAVAAGDAARIVSMFADDVPKGHQRHAVPSKYRRVATVEFPIAGPILEGTDAIKQYYEATFPAAGSSSAFEIVPAEFVVSVAHRTVAVAMSIHITDLKTHETVVLEGGSQLFELNISRKIQAMRASWAGSGAEQLPFPPAKL